VALLPRGSNGAAAPAVLVVDQVEVRLEYQLR
jgi:hypothetical protein